MKIESAWGPSAEGFGPWVEEKQTPAVIARDGKMLLRIRQYFNPAKYGAPRS